ncbi:MAG TPA: AraC family transcriptional regulator [Fimbriimonadaceae bacterium]|nr:AraC family transcriptional regulator [Fimbriimonadaceae bacterium]
MAALVEAILRDPPGPHSVEEMARRSGYSRAHFSRRFAAKVGESASEFVQRIRLEMAGFLLGGGADSVDGIGQRCGYLNASAFARAFLKAYCVSPTQFREGSGDWKLPSPEDLHWNPVWLPESDDVPRLSLSFPIVRRPRNPVWIAGREVFGSYGCLRELWEGQTERIEGLESRRFFTIYHDKAWTHPQAGRMRAHLAYELEPNESPRPGFERILLPAGMYNTIESPVRRDEREVAWSWIVKSIPDSAIAFDEYEGPPLPFDRVTTCIWCL